MAREKNKNISDIMRIMVGNMILLNNIVLCDISDIMRIMVRNIILLNNLVLCDIFYTVRIMYYGQKWYPFK